MNLRLRFAISFILIALVSIVAVVAFARVNVAREVNTYMFRGGMVGVNVLVSNLEVYYQSNGSWEGVNAQLDAARTNGGHMAGMLGKEGQGAMQQDMLLADMNYEILYDTRRARMGEALSVSEKAGAIVLLGSDSQPVGYLFISGGMQFQPGADRELVDKLNQAAINAGLIAGGLSLLVAGLLGYLILRPVQRLTAAANRIASGDLAERVPVNGNDEMAVLGKAFNTMAQSLETAQINRKAMTADIAHELRTPLAIQRAILEAITDGIYPLDLQQIQLVTQQNQSLTRLVDDLRILALADAGELRLDIDTVDAKGLLSRLVAEFEPTVAERSIQLAIPGVDMNGQWLVRADAFRLGQVIKNLLSNACRYSPDGGAVISQLSREGNWILLSISDSGSGIPAGEEESIFERFFRSDQSRSREDGGTGLGLAIARQLARAHGGDLTAINKPEGGAQFNLRLPAA